MPHRRSPSCSSRRRAKGAERASRPIMSLARRLHGAGRRARSLCPSKFVSQKASGPASLAVEWTTNEDNRPRPFPLRRLLLPWADTSGKAADTRHRRPPARTRRRQLGPRIPRVLRREGDVLEVPHDLRPRRQRSGPICRISSIAITHRCCATLRIRASPSIRIISRTRSC